MSDTTSTTAAVTRGSCVPWGNWTPVTLEIEREASILLAMGPLDEQLAVCELIREIEGSERSRRPTTR